MRISERRDEIENDEYDINTSMIISDMEIRQDRIDNNDNDMRTRDMNRRKIYDNIDDEMIIDDNMRIESESESLEDKIEFNSFTDLHVTNGFRQLDNKFMTRTRRPLKKREELCL